MTNQHKIPMLVLGGSNPEPAQLPPGGRNQHPLTGCKGVDVRIDGRRLIEILTERLQATGRLGPIYVAGPARAYREAHTPVEVIDTDANFGRNIRIGIEAVLERHPGEPIAIITSDIVPELSDLEPLLENYFANAPADLWFPIIRAPRDRKLLGESAWKPQYRIVPTGELEPVPVLPGHLTIIDPEALRLRFLYRLMDLGYRSRNRPVLYRRADMLQQVIWTLLTQDLLHIVRLRLPTFSWDVVRHGTVAARKLSDGVITQSELEEAMRHIFSKRRHRRRFPERRIQTPLLEGLSLARDIDTQEEAREASASTPRTAEVRR